MKTYEQIVDMCGADVPNDRLNITYMAILNLTTSEEIQAFYKKLKLFYPFTYKKDIAYMLSFFDKKDRILWKTSLKNENVGINIDFNRSRTHLYNRFRMVNAKGEPIPYKVNTEKGKHQSR